MDWHQNILVATADDNSWKQWTGEPPNQPTNPDAMLSSARGIWNTDGMVHSSDSTISQTTDGGRDVAPGILFEQISICVWMRIIWKKDHLQFEWPELQEPPRRGLMPLRQVIAWDAWWVDLDFEVRKGLCDWGGSYWFGMKQNVKWKAVDGDYSCLNIFPLARKWNSNLAET